MNIPQILCTLTAAAAVLAAAAAVILYRRSTRKTLATIHKMLDAAIDGSFSEDVFDESSLSAAEAKLSRYLAVCTASSRNLTLEKDKIKSLISDISHQTKTPVANILLYSQLLSEHDLPDDCAVCARALSAQAEKLGFLIGALVKMSRLETGILTVSPKTQPVQALLDEVVKQIMPGADAKGISAAAETTG